MAKEDLNLGGSSAAAFITSLRTGISSIRQEMNLLKQDTSGWSSALGGAMSRLGGRGGGYGSPGNNVVAPIPVFNVTTLGDTSQDYMYRQSGHNVLFSSPGIEPYRPLPTAYMGGGGGQPGGGAGGGFGAMGRRAVTGGVVGAVAAMPTAREAVEYELATQRMVFYQQQASYQPGGRIRPFSNLIPGNPDPNSDYARATALLQQLGQQGTTTGRFDTVAAMEAARQLGIGGPNFANVALGAAQMSNITPGIGVEGSMRAFGAVQQARNVNMLRGIGIRIRGEDGSLKPMPQIIDEIWQKLNREKMGSEPITVQDVQISLQPGNALASMLDQYFGNDPLLRKQVEDGLMLKARSGGARFAGRDLKKLGEQYGATTPAVSSLSQRITESTRGLQQAAPAMSDAFTAANRVISYFTGFINLIDRFTGIFTGLGAVKSGVSTLLGGGPGNILSGIVNFAANIPFLGQLIPGRAEGGPVGGKMPYIVGEQGPELFVPKVDGTIVPNHELKNSPFRSGGGSVAAGGYGLSDKSTPEEWAKALLKALNAPINQDSVDALKTWARFEGGHYANGGTHGARYNPLNTSLKLPGSGPMSEKNQLVQRYKSWDQGIEATVKTLTGNRADERGYAAIVNALRSGEDRDTILALVNKSAWVHGEGKNSNYKFKGSSSKYDVNFSGGSPDASVSTTPGERYSMSKFFSENQAAGRNFISDFFKGFTSLSSPSMKTQAQTNATTYNYGGVTVNLTGGANPEANAAALKAALQNTETLNSAARN